MDKKIKIDALARVEGHGGITVEIKDNKVKNVRVEIYEGPRLIETLVIGKTPEEDLNIVPRICAICTLSHRYAAIRGLERALGIDPPEKVKLLRELMHLGEMLESHSLHVFVLALPDFLGYPSAIAMIDKYKDDVVKALQLKKYANKIMRVVSGRMIHGENPIVGGFGKFPTKKELLEIKEETKKMLPIAERGVEIMASLDYPDYAEANTVFMCLNPPNGEFGFVGDSLLFSTGEEYDVEKYKEAFSERVVSYSFAKRSRYKGQPFSVGALARINNIGDRLKGKAGAYYRKYHDDKWLVNPIYNNFAQAIEMVYCLEEIPKLIDKIVKMPDCEIVKPERLTGTGTGSVEAPRGTLLHHYEIKDYKITKSDIITPTAMNLDDIERYIGIAAEKLVERKEIDSMNLQLEMIARAYDPCISCSAHLVKVIRK
ncbi:MAG: Ni/Fe hydrogenase subunit alpha [Candidatus Asgardarchaeia archaeon]